MVSCGNPFSDASEEVSGLKVSADLISRVRDGAMICLLALMPMRRRALSELEGRRITGVLIGWGAKEVEGRTATPCVGLKPAKTL